MATLKNTDPMNLNLTSATRMGLNALALLGIAIALRLGESIFIPLTVALLLAAILWPVAEWLHRRRIRWSMACMIAVSLLVVLFIAVTVGFTLAVAPMLQGLPNPSDDEAVQAQYYNFRNRVAEISPFNVDTVLPPKAADSRLLRFVKDALRTENLSPILGRGLMHLGSLTLQLVLIIFVVFFLLLEGKMLTLRVVEIFGPSAEAQSRAVNVLSEIARSVRAYLIWRTLVNIGLAAVLGAVYQILGLNQAWTWALLALVLCYVPYIGTILAGVPPVLDAFVYVGPGTALGILIFYIAVVTFEGYLIVPVVMGRSMELNATTVLLACLFWDLVWGTPGLFLAMPLMAALKAVCMSVPGWRPWANLMGTSEEPAPPELEHVPQPPLPVPPPDGAKAPALGDAPVLTKNGSPPG